MSSADIDRAIADGSVQLSNMATELEQFLLAQVDRLEEEVRQAAARKWGQRQESALAGASSVAHGETGGSSSGNTARGVTSGEQVDWEALRDAEADRLRSDAQLLQQAWQKYEEEQRRLLAEKELARRGVQVGKLGPVVAGGSTGHGEPTAAYPNPQNQGGNDDQSAWLQFQRMRREIQTRSRFKP
jgi:hypothetical protein